MLNRLENSALDALREAESCVETGRYERARKLAIYAGDFYQRIGKRDIGIINRINRVCEQCFDAKYLRR